MSTTLTLQLPDAPEAPIAALVVANLPCDSFTAAASANNSEHWRSKSRILVKIQIFLGASDGSLRVRSPSSPESVGFRAAELVT
jgi:hypothetical protein